MPLLDWLNKSEALKAAAAAPFRLLEEVPELSYGDEASDNMIIQGDNLDGVKGFAAALTRRADPSGPRFLSGKSELGFGVYS